MSFAPPQAASPELWVKLEALDLDGGAQLSFSQRLARDNGWTGAFARRVVVEHKKFGFLAATCGHPVTPSDEVDQAWRLHLVYTRSYWDDMCGQVLGFPLHHGTAPPKAAPPRETSSRAGTPAPCSPTRRYSACRHPMFGLQQPCVLGKRRIFGA